jgi:large-conductance mechanosensitive channel
VQTPRPLAHADAPEAMTPDLLNPRIRSLARGNVIVLASLALATAMSHFPRVEPAPWLVVPAIGCIIGTADTVRCMRKRWSFYHGGVLLCIYMDLLIITLILFFLLYPYLLWLTGTN